MSGGVCLCFHAHFYQPPRENPWLEAIEKQPSAAPFHDWNERIFRECYLPNVRALILNPSGQIVDIVNNFERMSFNIGPTLFSWIETHHPEAYRMILEADRRSMDMNNGHGNAIAQVYNHVIMTLAPPRDQITQIRWGVGDFRHRFGREPEGMWLAETACNDGVLEALIEEGLKFTILSPHQAESVRPLDPERKFGYGDWRGVGDGSIDPRRAYRFFSRTHPGKFINLFFYDGPISKAMGFEGLLFDANLMSDRLAGCVDGAAGRPQLVHTAVDGETFGHHKAFGERVLAYVNFVRAEQMGWRVVNYAHFLEISPPAFEVNIKAGPKNEGTAWSCAHGVGRWKEHCGCRGDGPPEWHQKWRGPLRAALDWLRDETSAYFAAAGAEIFEDPDKARNEYIGIVVNRAAGRARRFLNRQAGRELSPEEQCRAMRLLEGQRNAMLMYTSCAWFFTELSGIETQQVIQYAARLIQLHLEVAGVNLEGPFLERLAAVPGNLPGLANARLVYEKLVKPRIASFEHVVCYYAVGALFEPESHHDAGGLLRLSCFDLKALSRRKESRGSLTLSLGRLVLTSRITLHEKVFVFAVVRIGDYDFRCSVREFGDLEEYGRIEKDLFEDLEEARVVELFRKMDFIFGNRYYALNDLLTEDRMNIIGRLSEEAVTKTALSYQDIYDGNRRLLDIYRLSKLVVPEVFGFAARTTLDRRFMDEMRSAAARQFHPRKLAHLMRVFDDARGLGIEIRTEPAADFLVEELMQRIEGLAENPTAELIAECLNILKLAKKLNLELVLNDVQFRLFGLIRSWRAEPERVPDSVREIEKPFHQLARELKLADTAI
ncbi:MAG: DUF3536 domain-containing protein [Candidatus Omnitrophica bacterium]|nr:DUF3536 domain-containing protein [Candidatus Omnitrophota bacterium]